MLNVFKDVEECALFNLPMNRVLMKQTVVVIDADKNQCRALCDLLAGQQYQAVPVHSLESVKGFLQEELCHAVLLDLDTVPIDNRGARELAQLNPGAQFFCISGQRFHPELKEAIHNHFFACLYKPVDPDELFYLLNCIRKNGGESPAPEKK